MPRQATKKTAGKRGRRSSPQAQKNSKGQEMMRDEDLIRKLNQQYDDDKIDGYMGNVNLPTDKSVFRYNEDRVLAIKQSCEDILFFAEKFFYILSTDDGKILIQLHDFQKDMLEMFMGNRKNIVCTSRQIGKTTIMCIYVLWLVTFFEYQNVVIVANKEKTAKEILKRIKLAYEELPGWIKPAVDKGGWSKESINFSNGSTVKISATSADAIRGMAVSCLILDELAFVDDGIVEDFWSAVYPTISSSKKAKVLIASTPNGVGNKFHELWEGVEDGNGFKRLQVTWRQAGKTEEWAKAEEATMGSREKFLQEYECVFLQSNQSSISDELFTFLKRTCKDPEIVLDDGKFKIWEKPDLEDGIYSAGCDTCEGVGGNNGVLNIFDLSDLTNIKQVAQYIANDVHPHDYGKRMNEILSIWGKPPLAIERNGTSGGMILDSMVNIHNYPHIIDFERGNVSDYVTKSKLRGVKANNTTKAPSVMNMFYYLKERRAVELRDLETLNELRTYVRGKTGKWGKMSDKVEDDRVDALVWGLLTLDPKVVNQFYIVEMSDVNKRPLQIRRGYTVYSNKKEHDDYRFLFPTNDYSDLPNPYLMGGTTQMNDMMELQSQGWVLADQHNSYSGYITF